MSTEDDKRIDALEAQMRGNRPRTVVQDRIAAGMAAFSKQLIAERAQADEVRRLNSAAQRLKEQATITSEEDVEEPELQGDEVALHGRGNYAARVRPVR